MRKLTFLALVAIVTVLSSSCSKNSPTAPDEPPPVITSALRVEIAGLSDKASLEFRWGAVSSQCIEGGCGLFLVAWGQVQMTLNEEGVWIAEFGEETLVEMAEGDYVSYRAGGSAERIHVINYFSDGMVKEWTNDGSSLYQDPFEAGGGLGNSARLQVLKSEGRLLVRQICPAGGVDICPVPSIQ